MNKRGFTLIELLAVIVILAIIALIATPIVLNIIKDSRESAGLRSAEMYLKGVETSVATATINKKKVEDGTYPITPDGDICLVELTNNKCEGDNNTLEVEMNGEKPESGSITISSGKITDIELTYSNKKTIVKNDGKLVYDEKVEYIAYSVGDTVTIGTENFYVLKDSDKTNPNVTLLAKDCIDTTTLEQKSIGSTSDIIFSETNYWNSIEGITYPYDLIETGEPDASHKAARTAYDYGAKVGGTGRLMTYSEATTLQAVNPDILYGTNGKSSSSVLYYFLGAAESSGTVKIVEGYPNGDGGFSFVRCIDSLVNDTGHVRPVVEISKDKIL